MFKLRCLHPPGGAVALTAILGGPGIHQMGYHFVLYPVLLNSVLLAALAILFNNLAGRRYPHALAPAEAKPANLPIDAVSITRGDLHEALMEGICSISTRTICRRSCCAPSSWRISGKAKLPDQPSVLR